MHVNQITAQALEQGFNAGDINNAINNLSNEGRIYSTIDENNFQYAEDYSDTVEGWRRDSVLDDAVLQVIKLYGGESHTLDS